MITKKTAAEIWNCYQEIENAMGLLKEMEERQTSGRDPNPRDAFGRHRSLQLGVPSSNNDSHKLLDVSPRLAISIITAHVANKEALLVEMNERARIEVANQLSTTTVKEQSDEGC